MKNVSKLVLGLTLFLMLGISCASAETISFDPSNITVNPGSTQEVDILIDALPYGLSGYAIEVTVQDSSAAEITAVSYPGWAVLNGGTLASPASSVDLSGVDLMDGVKSGGIVLATITILGLEPAETEIGITVFQMDDDNGGIINAPVINATVLVQDEPTTVVFEPDNDSMIIGCSVDFELIADMFPSGLAGYNATISVEDSTIAEITEVSFPGWAVLNDFSDLPAASVDLSAVDMGNQVVAGNMNVYLGFVTVEGLLPGTTNITLQITQMDSDSGWDITTIVLPATIETYMPILPGCTASPTDLNGDGVYEDINGNGRMDFADIVKFYENMNWITNNVPAEFFDYNGNGRIDFNDVVNLYGQM